ncbi:MAG TPA: UDP-2,3-diacylglucosamine hydrolase [Thermotogaceae bacterium]|nr:UDP-2,3-diacylglucosamine hydrolase [Thermotogaceae bacterium]
MKVFISDLHIGDGSAKDDFVFDDEFEKLVSELNHEKDVELIIVGDGFELLESVPVREMGLVSFEELLINFPVETFDLIVKKHSKALMALRNLAKRHRLIYIVGNHDYYMMKNAKLKEKIQEFFEKIEIVPMYYDRDWGILAIHGNQFDVINKFSVDRRSGHLIPPLGDYITRYMMINFDKHFEDAPKILKEYDNVKPFFEVFHWFEHVMEAYDVGVNILEFWTKTFLEMFKTAEAKWWMKSNFPKTHWLSKVFINRIGGMKLGEFLVRTIAKLRSARKFDYLYTYSKKILSGRRQLKKTDLIGYVDDLPEIDYSNLNGMFFGHTHNLNMKILKIKDRYCFYSNCGSWKPSVQKAENEKKTGFYRKAELGYSMIEKHGEELEIKTGIINKLVNRLDLPLKERGTGEVLL